MSFTSRQREQEIEFVIAFTKIHGTTFLTTTTDFSRRDLLQSISMLK